MEATKEFAALNFKAMVKTVAGEALLAMVSGEKWESIFYRAIGDACAWRMSQQDVLDMKTKCRRN
jgi:hypothetical protein